jgi:hypothetical protein
MTGIFYKNLLSIFFILDMKISYLFIYFRKNLNSCQLTCLFLFIINNDENNGDKKNRFSYP